VALRPKVGVMDQFRPKLKSVSNTSLEICYATF
jgi:hypothetical protein